MTPPRILIIDDMFGRTLRGQRNVQRAKLCGQYQIKDITGDEAGKPSSELLPEVEKPIAEAVLCRGQSPACANVGDTVQNDLLGCIEAVRGGWFGTVKEGQATWALVLLDLSFETGRVTPESDKRREGMPEGCDDDTDPKKYFGLKLLEELKRQFPDLPVIIFSSMPREDVAREYLEKGGHAFLERGQKDSPQKLREFLSRYGLFPDESTDEATRIIGRSKPLLLALRSARAVAPADVAVLLRGMTGSGKEMFARFIHRSSGRGTQPFFAINMASIPAALAESELFGHVKGAFTGAVQARKGIFELATNGTVFLDEIGDASATIQAKLLRFFTTQAVLPVGGSAERPVNARVVSATDQDIEVQSQKGTFRPQLLERLRGATISIPSLREIKEDIPLLAEHLIRKAEAKYRSPMRRNVGDDVFATLSQYDWPGNIRQLENVLREAVLRNLDAEVLLARHLPDYLRRPRTSVVTDWKRATTTEIPGAEGPLQQADVAALLNALDQCQIDPANVTGWAWKLDPLLEAFVRLIGKLFKAAAEQTKEKTPSNPQGTVQYQAAINLLLSKKTTGTNAADLIKRLLRLHPPATTELMKDPTLAELHRRAMEARPAKNKDRSK